MKRSGPWREKVGAAWLLLLGALMLGGVFGVEARPQPVSSDVRERISALQAEIARHDALYFRQAQPEITDAEYDRLKRALSELEAAHPEFARSGPGFGDDRSGRRPVHAHRQRMRGLAKVYTETEWRAFHATLMQRLGQPEAAFVIEPKYDGVAISLVYEQGRLVRALTRGNGREGDEVTANVRTIAALPEQLPSAGAAVPALVELRGEIYLDQAEFARLNAAREAAGEAAFAHPRNLAAGTLQAADPAVAAERRLSVVIYAWGAWEGSDPPRSQQAFHAQVRAWGLPGVSRYEVAHTADAIWQGVQVLGQERAGLGFPIDGAVVKLDDTGLRARVGEDETAPRWAVACKYAPERARTRLRAILWQVGRTGILTPVAEFEPVKLGGATVTRASLYNREEIARRDLRVGDIIEVEKAGEIIPVVVGVQTEQRGTGSEPYVFPVRCPSCGEPVEVKGGEAGLRCPNTHCPTQRQRRLEHFASAAAVGIDGLGPAAIAGLVAAGLVESPADFYRLRREDLQQVEGIGEKTAGRLLTAIERSKQAELWRFIHGLGIPQIGAVTSRDLARLAGDLDGFARLDAAELGPVIGPAAAETVRDFLAQPKNQADLRALLAAGVRPQQGAVVPVRADLAGKVFVFTGTLPGMNRAQGVAAVQAAGGLVRDGVSRKTDYVVAGEGAGAKRAEARRLGVTVLTPQEFRALLALP